MKDKLASELKQLNSAQAEAVSHRKGPLLVVAGAGTGKTRVIVDRIVALIDEGVPADSILALTFTEKAAAQMFDRLNELRGGYTLDTTIQTFNAFGADLLRQFASDIGLSPNPTLLGETGQLVFLRQHLDELELDYYAPLNAPHSQVQNLANYFSLLKQQLVDPNDYLQFAKNLPRHSAEDKLEADRHKELARAYQTYLSISRKENVIDYDDQIYLVVDLLRRRANVAKRLQKQYSYVLVDEYQDTNPMQAALLDAITSSEKNIMVVGDDDQSIYGWRGATLANILDFPSQYPKTKEVTLIENYRSSQAILDAAYSLIQNNNPNRLESMLSLNKKLVAVTPAGDKPLLRHFSSLDSELAWVAGEIEELVQKGQGEGGIAVLARSNRVVARIHEALESAGVDHVVAGLSDNLYRQDSVRQLVEALRAVSDVDDSVALFHTLSGPLFELDPQLLAEASAEARRHHQTLRSRIDDEGDEKAQTAVATILEWQAYAATNSVGSVAYKIISESGWKDRLYGSAESDEATALQVQALGQFFMTLKDFERAAFIPSTLNYLENYDTLSSAGSDLSDDTLELHADKVNVLSIHKAKGLEWNRVYIVDCVEGSFPLRNYGSSMRVPDELKVRVEADEHMAEERRLMYVAMTRAKSHLTISHSDRHSTATPLRPSRFISEIGDSLLDRYEQPDPAGEQLNFDLFSEASTRRVGLPGSMVSGENIVLTSSQIGDYMRCPQDFYYRHILNVPPPPDSSGGYGTLIHEVIQTIHEAKKRGRTPDEAELLAYAEEHWPQTGYSSAAQRDRAIKQGRKTIKRLVTRLRDEQEPDNFEWPFRVHIPDSPLIISGRIDAIFMSKEGVEIRDYKTGTSVLTSEQANRRARSSNQLSVYALAWKLMHEGQLPQRLVLDFVETDQLGSVRKQPATLDKLEGNLADIANDIKEGRFPPGSRHNFCRHPL